VTAFALDDRELLNATIRGPISGIDPMRTALLLIAGFLLLGAALLLGKLFSGNYPHATAAATVVYLALWFIIATANLWTGVTKAGYPVAEELPIFALIFALPAVVAIIVKWKVL
jgi:hypothetical protein